MHWRAAIKKVQLRDWQKKACEKWIVQGNGIASVVTGGGKTVFALSCMALVELKVNRVVIVVPTTSLRDQWIAVLKGVLEIRGQEIATDYPFKKRIHVVTANLMNRRNVNPPPKTFLIADECHRYGTPLASKWLEKDWSYTLGLTATLERQYDDGVDEILLPNLGNVFFKYDLQKALSDGVVEQFEAHNVFAPLSESEQDDYKKLTKRIILAQRNDEPEKVKRFLIQRKRLVNESRARTLASIKLILQNRHRKIIVFFNSIRQLLWVSEQLSDRGFSHVSYHSKQSSSTNVASLVKFSKNFERAILSCNALDEGFDCQDLDTAIIVSQSNSERQRVQRIGRALRKFNGKRPVVYTFYSTDEEGDRLEQEFANSEEIYVQWLELSL